MVERVSGQDFLSSSEVLDLHRNSDKDKRSDAQHHTLGRTRFQASPGDHNHNGGSSSLLVPNQTPIVPSIADGSAGTPVVPSFTFTQNLETPQGQKDAIKQIIAVLASLGVTDATQSNNGVAPFLGHAWYPFEIVYGIATITWTTAVALSDLATSTFSPPFTIAPRMVFGMVSTDAAILFSPRMAGSPTTTSVSYRVLASTAMSAGATRPLHWIALSAKQFT